MYGTMVVSNNDGQGHPECPACDPRLIFIWCARAVSTQWVSALISWLLNIKYSGCIQMIPSQGRPGFSTEEWEVLLLRPGEALSNTKNLQRGPSWMESQAKFHPSQNLGNILP